MTNKTTMPDPVGEIHINALGNITHEHLNPCLDSGYYYLITTAQAEAYAAAKVREALEAQRAAALQWFYNEFEDEKLDEMEAAGIISQAEGYSISCVTTLKLDMDEAVNALIPTDPRPGQP